MTNAKYEPNEARIKKTATEEPPWNASGTKILEALQLSHNLSKNSLTTRLQTNKLSKTVKAVTHKRAAACDYGTPWNFLLPCFYTNENENATERASWNGQQKQLHILS